MTVEAHLLESLRQRQQFMDQFCAAWDGDYRRSGGTLYCGNGCGGCCSLVVNCTALEAIAIAQQLSETQLQRLRSRIDAIRKAAWQATSLKDWLETYRREMGGCPFLEPDSSCGIYPHRPLSCRSLHSTKEAHWCSTDFSSLSKAAKQVFMGSLDRSVVAFPTHYVATLQEIGQELELATLNDMEQSYGCTLLGNLPWLVWASTDHQLEALLEQGAQNLRQTLAERDLLHPFLAVCSE